MNKKEICCCCRRWFFVQLRSTGADSTACLAQILGRTKGGNNRLISLHCFTTGTPCVDTLYRPLRWILKRQYKKADSPIHYKASRITFSSDTVEPCKTQYTVFLEMETIWPRLANSLRLCPHWQQRRCYTKRKRKKAGSHWGIFATEIYWT